MADIAYPLPLEYVSRRPAFTVFLPFDLLDAGGRPLMESRTLAHRGVLRPLISCPYSDYRAQTGKPMNADALAAFNRLGPRTLDLIGRYSATICRRQPNEGPHVLLLWRISKLAVGAVSRLGVRQTLAATATPIIDPAAGAVFKVARGLETLFESMARDRGSLANCTVDFVLDFVEHFQMLEGQREVCAAPQPLIRRVLTHLVETAQGMHQHHPLDDDELCYVALQSLAERICFVTQVVRSSICARINSGSAKSGVRPPSVRHTFATAREASDIGRGEPNDAANALNLLIKLHWDDTIPEGEQALRALVVCGQATIKSEESEAGELWNLFRQSAVRALERVNVGIAQVEKMTDVRPLTDRDFELFFGPLLMPA